MTATTRNGFDTVSQSGSSAVWSGLSNMLYPTEGEASATLTSSVRTTNRIYLSVPHEASGIPTGATFDSMSLSMSLQKTGSFSSGTDLYWLISTNLSSATVGAYTHTIDETYQNVTLSGTDSYWKITAYTPSQIITALKSGSLKFTIYTSTTVAIACGARIKSATILINYTGVSGERGAIVAAIL
jgi:hypothetical protein